MKQRWTADEVADHAATFAARTEYSQRHFAAGVMDSLHAPRFRERRFQRGAHTPAQFLTDIRIALHRPGVSQRTLQRGIAASKALLGAARAGAPQSAAPRG